MVNLTPSPYQSGGRRPAIQGYLDCSITSWARTRCTLRTLVVSSRECGLAIGEPARSPSTHASVARTPSR